MQTAANVLRSVYRRLLVFEPPAPRDAIYLLLGAFATFFSIGPMSELLRAKPYNLGGMLLSGTIGGCIALGYAYSGVFRKAWLIPAVVLFQLYGGTELFKVAIRAGLIWTVAPEDVDLARIRAIVTAILAIACGYIFLLAFGRRLGRLATEQRTQLAIAAEMHRAIVPAVDITAGGVQIVGRSDASSVMGGDLIDTVGHNGGIDVVLADVSGHGVKAGIIMAMLKASVRTLLGASGSSRADLAASTKEISRVLAELSEPGMFATFMALRVPLAADSNGVRNAELCTAGHGPLLHFVAARKHWVEIENDCLPLGVAAEEVFPARMLPLGPGDRLVILTDGLTEAFGLSGVEFGTEGIRRTLDRLGPASPQQLCDGLIAASRAHGPQGDDQSVIVIAIAP